MMEGLCRWAYGEREKFCFQVGPQNLPGPSRSGSVAPATMRVIERRISTTEMPEGACMWATREAEKMIHSRILSGPNTYLKRGGPKFHGEIKHLVPREKRPSWQSCTVTLQIFPKILYASKEFWGKTSVKSFFPSISPPRRSIVQSGA